MSAQSEEYKQELTHQLKVLSENHEIKLTELQSRLDSEVSKNITLTRELLEVQENLAVVEEKLHATSLHTTLPSIDHYNINTTTNSSTILDTSNRLERELKDTQLKYKSSIDDCQSFVEALHKSEDQIEKLESELKEAHLKADQSSALYEKEKEELLLQVIELESSCGRLTERVSTSTQTITDNQVCTCSCTSL